MGTTWVRLSRAALVAAVVVTVAGPAAASPGRAGASGRANSARAAAAAKVKAIAMKDNFFSPKTLKIPEGSKVKWVNEGENIHTTTGGGWDETLSPGESYTRKFKKTGTFTYRCEFHPGMEGKIKVT